MVEKKTEIIFIEEAVHRFSACTRKGQLGIELGGLILTYSPFELQVIGGRLNQEIFSLPPPYRHKIKPFFHDQVFGAYHQLISRYRKGLFSSLNEPIQDIELFLSYCQMIPSGCQAWDESVWKNPHLWGPRLRFFYYLISAFTMFVMDKPGHPVGMPFPGGQKVKQRGREYFCPIRDHEEDVFFSICNFCPAKQSDTP